MDGEGFVKLVSTAVVWTVLGIVSIMGIIFADLPANDDGFWLVMGPLLLAFLTTAIIWMGREIAGIAGYREAQRTTAPAEKAKRAGGQSKMDLLLEMMDDDEREAFKQMLKQQTMREMRLSEDGELLLDADLCDDNTQSRRMQ